MFKSLVKRQPMPIGVDFGAHSIRMLQLEPRGDGYAVAASAQDVLPARTPESGEKRHELQVQLLQKLYSEGSFDGKQVVSCLPAHVLHYKNLRVPKMPPDELRGAVEWEAADRLGLSSDRMRLRFFDAGEVRQGEEVRQEIILMAAPIPDVDDHTAVLLDAGLRPSCVEVAASALARVACPARRSTDDELLQVVLDVGYAASKVLVLRNGRVAFFKMIDIGGGTFDEGVAQRLGLSVHEAAAMRRRIVPAAEGEKAESADQPLFGDTRKETVERAVSEAMRSAVTDLGKELGLCLRYYSVTFRGNRPDVIHLAGGESCNPHLAEMLSETTGIETRPLSVTDRIDFAGAAPSPNHPCTQWVTAAGLALWQPQRAVRKKVAA